MIYLTTKSTTSHITLSTKTQKWTHIKLLLCNIKKKFPNFNYILMTTYLGKTYLVLPHHPVIWFAWSNPSTPAKKKFQQTI